MRTITTPIWIMAVMASSVVCGQTPEWPALPREVRLIPKADVLRADRLRVTNGAFHLHKAETLYAELPFEAQQECEQLLLGKPTTAPGAAPDAALRPKTHLHLAPLSRLWSQAARLPTWQAETSTSYETLEPYSKTAELLSRFKRLEIEQALTLKNWNQVSDLLVNQIRCATRIGIGMGSEGQLLTAGLLDILAEDLEYVLRQSGIPKICMDIWKFELEEAEKKLPPLSEAIRFEHLRSEHIMTKVIHGRDSPKKLLQHLFPESTMPDEVLAAMLERYADRVDKEESLAHLASFWGRMLLLYEQPYRTPEPELSRFIGAVLETRGSRVEDPAACLLVRTVMSQVLAAPDAHYRSLARLRGMHTRVALVQYEQEEGRLPETLKALTPDYLKAIPNDPTARAPQPMVYVTGSNWVLYSLGRNQKNDGGYQFP